LKTFYEGRIGVKNGIAYFARVVSYIRKMFMKLTAGVSLIKLFSCVLRKFMCSIIFTVVKVVFYGCNVLKIRQSSRKD
jgi:hypothetical protein